MKQPLSNDVTELAANKSVAMIVCSNRRNKTVRFPTPLSDKLNAECWMLKRNYSGNWLSFEIVLVPVIKLAIATGYEALGLLVEIYFTAGAT